MQELGAEVLVNYKEEDFLPVAKREGGQPRLTGVPGGGADGLDVSGVDVILDLVGASNFEANISALTVEGRLLLVGLPSGSKAQINLAQVCSRLRALTDGRPESSFQQQQAHVFLGAIKHSMHVSACEYGYRRPCMHFCVPEGRIFKVAMRRCSRNV